MTQPRWMQGTPVEDDNQPRWMRGEVLSEGGPQSFGTVREAVDALPSFLTRTADEKSADKVDANNRAFVESLGGLDKVSGAGTFAGQYLNSSSFGLGDEINAGIDTALGINTMGDSYSQRKGNYRNTRGQLMEDNPLWSLAGDIGGYIAPGAAAWKGMSAAARSIPGAATLTNAAQSAGRVPAYLQRLMGSSALFTADAALHGATVGASNEAALTGQDPTIANRAQTGAKYASTNVGDMAEGFGVNVPSFLKPIPVTPMMPVAGSIVERTAKGLGSGGKMITPDRVQAEVMNNVGRAPSPNSTAIAMAEVIPGERVTSGTVKTFRFVENALRNGLKDAGLSPTDISSRVARGFNSIKQSLPALADGSTTLAQLIEREFADAGSQVSENLRLFLLRVGLDDPAVTRGVIQEIRSGQVDDFRNVVDENLGSQRQYDVEQSLKGGLKKIGETYSQILDKAKSQGNNSPLSHSLREELSQSRFKFELTEEASKAGWKDVDAFIQNDPWKAAHQLKSKLLSEARAAKSSGNYEKYQEPAVYLREMLNELPGYQTLSRQFADEAQVLDTLGHVKTLPNGEKVTKEGFGPKLRKAAPKETETLRMADEFSGMPARQQDAAKISTGQILKDQLRTARPGGTDLQGQDVVGLRLLDLQNEGMMSTRADMPGALPAVFGEAGKTISNKVDDIVNSRKFLADIDPDTGSNTVNKANALAAGDSVITGGLPRTVTQGFSQPALLDAALFASGMPPVATMVSKIPFVGRKLAQPSKATRAEVARTLMQRPARMVPPPGGPAPIKPMTGRNRPRKWKKDPKWSDPNLTNPQIEGGASADGLRGYKAKKAADAAALGAVAASVGGKADAQEIDYAAELEGVNARISEIEANQIPALEAELAELTDPDIDPKRLQALLQARGFDLGRHGIDGKIGEDTKAARRNNIELIRSEIEQRRGALEQMRTLQADIRRSQTYAETQENPMSGWLQKGVEGAGLVGGLWLGNRLRRGAVRNSQTAADAVTKQADDLINTAPISRTRTGPDSLNERAGNVNDFWRLGGAEDSYPFKSQVSTGEWRTRPNAADSSELFPPPKRFDPKDAAIIGGGAIDAGGFEVMRHNAQAKLTEVEDEIERYRNMPNANAELTRALEEKQRLEAFVAIYSGLSRLGAGVAGGRALGAFKQPYARPKPNIGAAETEQAILRQQIAKNKTKPKD